MQISVLSTQIWQWKENKSKSIKIKMLMGEK